MGGRGAVYRAAQTASRLRSRPATNKKISLGDCQGPSRVFFDTNVLIYALAEDDRRSVQAEELLASGGVLSLQVLNEFVSVARRKILLSWSDVSQALDAFRILCPSPLPITVETQDAAVRIAATLGYNIYEALVIAAALKAGCATLYSEDLHDGQTIDGQLTIRNPFAKSSG
jgi:predicted nucleic acid-binding protein